MQQTLTLAAAPADYVYRRHALAVRIMHWINVVALTILLMSGLSIFNAHPHLYWGKSSYTGRPPILEMVPKQVSATEVIGVTRVFGYEFETTGVFGVSRNATGDMAARGFPHWMTIPDDLWLSMARAWHLFFAWVLVVNGLAYIVYTIASRHLARDLVPTRTDWRSIGREIADHLRLRHASGEAAKRYNVLQKLAYLVVIFVLLPLIVAAGLAMSPWLDTVIPGWVDVLGGRQSARTIHFVVAWLLVAFVAIHVFQVIVTGLWNNLRSMITGNYRVRADARESEEGR
jgi:thiosulfate reductase cytochrome b subunit